MVEKKKKKKSKISITTPDRYFSLVVRHRAGWRCEICKTAYDYRAHGLECSHYFGRTNRALRFHPLNCWANCTSCHFDVGGNPHKFTELYRGYLGEKDFLHLVSLSHRIVKLTKVDLKEIAAHYKAEHERQLQQVGYTGFAIAPIIQQKLEMAQ